MPIADIMANMTNLAILLLLFTLLIRLIIKNKFTQFILVSICAICVLNIKFLDGVTIIDVLRGIISDLSISGLLFLCSLAVIYFFQLPINLFNRTFCIVISALGLLLYLSAIDIIPFDIYRVGYRPHGFLVILCILCMLFLLVNYIFALIWLIALVAFLAKLQNSANLWDYLLDPVLWLICVSRLVLSRRRIKKIGTINKKTIEYDNFHNL
jgi:hypothetical protein